MNESQLPIVESILSGLVWYGTHSRYQSLGKVSEANTEAVKMGSRHIKLEKSILMRIMNKPVPRKTKSMNCIKNLMGKRMDEYENSPDSDSGSR